MPWSTGEFIWNLTVSSADSVAAELLCLRSPSQNRTPLAAAP
jgi:hypothetical protein